MSFFTSIDSQHSGLSSVTSAKYVFNYKINEFHDAIVFLNKLSDIVQFAFGDGYLSVEAIANAKSACGYVCFSGGCLAEYTLGDMHNVNDSDKRAQVSSKDLLTAMKHVKDGDTLTMTFGTGKAGDSCGLYYVNTREVTQYFDICSRDVPVTYRRDHCDVQDFRNVIVLPATKLNNIFKQFKDTDEIFIEATALHFGLSTHIDEKDRGHVASTVTALAPEAMDRYDIGLPMSLIVSARELRCAFQLLQSYAHLIIVAFDMGNKPMLVTFDDEHSDLKAQITLSVAGAKEYGDSAATSQSTPEPTVSSVQPGSSLSGLKLIRKNVNSMKKSQKEIATPRILKRRSTRESKENHSPPSKQTSPSQPVSHHDLLSPQQQSPDSVQANYFDEAPCELAPISENPLDSNHSRIVDERASHASKEFSFFSQHDQFAKQDDQPFPEFQDDFINHDEAEPHTVDSPTLLVEVLQLLGLENLSVTGCDVPVIHLPPPDEGNVYAVETQSEQLSVSRYEHPCYAQNY